MKFFQKIAFLILIAGLLADPDLVVAQTFNLSGLLERSEREYRPLQYVKAELKWEEDDPEHERSEEEPRKAFLELSIKLKEGHRISALKQEWDRGYFPTTIRLESSGKFEQITEFIPVHPPARVPSDIVAGDWLAHEGKVVWRAEIKVHDDFDLEDVVVTGKLRFLAPTVFA